MGSEREGQLAREDTLGLKRKTINFMEVLSIGREQVQIFFK